MSFDQQTALFHPELGTIMVTPGELSNTVRQALTTGLCGGLALEYIRQFGGTPYFVYPTLPTRRTLRQEYAEEPEWIFESLHVLVKVGPDSYLDANGVTTRADLLNNEHYVRRGVSLYPGTLEMLRRYGGHPPYDLTSFARTLHDLVPHKAHLGLPTSDCD